MTDDDDLAMYARISSRLVDVASRSLEGWVVSAVTRFRPDLSAEAAEAGRRCRDEVVAELDALLALDIDAQPTTPLVVLRRASRFPTQVLEAAGVAAPRRDPFDERANPDDHYDLGIATWSDLGPEMAEAGVMWGAAKAHLHLRRHRP